MAESETVSLRAIGSGRGADKSDEARSDDPLIGSILDARYLIEGLVGRGGFGNVYRAVHLRFDSPVAIKVLRSSPRLADSDRQRFIERFLAEGKLLFTLGALHPSIVRVFEAGTLATDDLGSVPYFVMEWLNGVALDREIEERARRGLRCFELAEVLELMGGCAEALMLAHGRGVVHRDIKPANIFLVQSEDGKRITKLLDFGLARVAAETAISMDTSSSIELSSVGGSLTPAYGAPEQWHAELGAIGPWTDVYALALVCTELLAGRRALSGSDRKQLMAACLDRSARPTPRALGADVSDETEAVLGKALAVVPADRFPDVGAFWSALGQCLSNVEQSISVTPSTVAEVTVAVPGPSQQPTKHFRWVALMLVVAVLTMIGFAQEAGEAGGAPETRIPETRIQEEGLEPTKLTSPVREVDMTPATVRPIAATASDRQTLPSTKRITTRTMPSPRAKLSEPGPKADSKDAVPTPPPTSDARSADPPSYEPSSLVHADALTRRK